MNRINRVMTATTASPMRQLTWSMALLFAAVVTGCGGNDPILGGGGGGVRPGVGGPAAAATGGAVSMLGLAAPMGIAATAGVTNTGTAPISHINGDVVLEPLAQCNTVNVDAIGGFGLCGGFAPTISGKVISPLYPDAGMTARAIKADLKAAFLSITPPAGPPAAGSLGGATNIPAGTTLGGAVGGAYVPGTNLFTPGVYQSLTSIMITGDLTLDGQGNPNATFVFQSSSSTGTATSARILLINGAKASNVWWQAASSATLGTNSVFQGNILAGASITMNTGATSCGRLLAGAFTAGAFVLDSNVISVPGNINAPLCI
jgi:Ice-binding-like